MFCGSGVALSRLMLDLVLRKRRNCALKEESGYQSFQTITDCAKVDQGRSNVDERNVRRREAHDPAEESPRFLCNAFR